MQGKFITFEGIESCGKTTQIRLLNDYLTKKGCKTILTREPGGTAIGDQIRHILLDPKNKEMHAVTEALLYEASRRQHIEELIRPALTKGKIILCDRYSDSTVAYQGAARKLSPKVIKQLDEIATGGLKPDLTILLDVTAKEGLSRANKRSAPDRFEQERLSFHEKVRRAYLALAKAEPKRIKVIDGSLPVKEIHEKIIEILGPGLRSSARGARGAVLEGPPATQNLNLL